MSLEQLSNIRVESASLVSTTVARAPAIVSVIDQDEMKAWGDRSVADALARVPGLYRVDAQGIHDIGVRGLFGGQRSWNRQVKVLIDGQPQAFRPNASNFLGPELIPMSAVARIEVIRGPGSALYGADAFLATINVITVKNHVGASDVKADLRAYAGSANGFDTVISGGFGNLGLLFAVQGEAYNLNDRQLPASSPVLGAQPALRGVKSKDARQQPLSVLGRASFDIGALKHQLEVNYSRMDSVAEFLDFGALNPNNRFSQYRGQIGWQTQWDIDPNWQAKLRWNVSQAGPSSFERLATDSATSYPRRDFSSRANDLGVNVNWAPTKDHALSFGADHMEDLQESMQVLRIAANGTSRLDGNPGIPLHLDNTGVFSQYLWQATEQLGLSANWRQDNHSRFGSNTNWRAAAVFEHSKELSAKLIWSTSYKAPSIFDLFAKPLYSGDVVGNPFLRAEIAQNTELQINWKPAPTLQVSANVYALEVKDKIEFQQTGLNYQPINRGIFSGHGGELDIRYESGPHRWGLAWTALDLNERTPVVLVGEVVRQPERFPNHSIRADWRWISGIYGQFAGELLYASKRQGTFSNGFANFLTPYSLAPITRLNLVWTQNIEAHELQLRLDNVLNASYSEPGYGGIDLPGRGRSLLLSYRYRWN
jgi:iron complex outermembrane receptor protein